MKKLKIGIAGLGRLGKVHAANIAYKIPNAELTAACSIAPAELEYAKSELGVTDVYTDYKEMLAKADIDAVAIVTTSSEHCWQIEAALDAGKHVFTEKPLGVNVEQCLQAEAAVARHPERAAAVAIVRHDHNRGSGAARLTAMSHATGDFVCFADSDDLMPADAVERLVERQRATGADIVDGAFDRLVGGRQTSPELPPGNRHYAELMVLQNTVSHQLWARLIRRSLFAAHAISFAEGVDQAEDYSVMCRLAFCATRATTPAVVYHYRMDREGSFSDGVSPRHVGSVLAANRLVINFLQREDHGHRCRLAARVGLVNACWQAVRAGTPIDEVRRQLGFPPRGAVFRLADALLARRATAPLARAEYLLLKRLYRCRLSLADALRPLRRAFRNATHSSRMTT